MRVLLPPLIALLGAVALPAAERFYPDDPLRADRDDLPIAKPKPVELSTTYDVIEHTFLHRPGSRVPPAANVSTLGEVPDSSWFTNRLGARPMTVEEIVRGPNQIPGPDTSGSITVIAAKSGGITPGFTIRDPRGEVFFVKFDPAANPNLSTAADVIGTKLFHAFGYHVPENYVAYLRRDQLVVAPDARVSVPGGKKRPMTPADLDRNLAAAARLPDGRIRVVASRRLSGEPLGPFKYHGLRGDDPNDVFPHEHRRELRGLRVFSAWLNHDDSRSVNTLDTFVRDGERGHVRHHLIDFSSTLGSGSNARREIAPQNPRAGNEYVVELGPALRSAVTLGIWERPWRKARYPGYPEVGNIEAEVFRPEAWKPEYPNPAFERMQPADAFWAARILSRLSDEAVRAVVHAGEFTDPEAERYLADTLVKRKAKTIAHYFGETPPLAEFEAAEGALRFRNLGVEAGVAAADGYEYQWRRLANADGTTTPLGAPGRSSAAALPIPDDPGPYLMARIRTVGGPKAWGRDVDVYLRREGGWTVVGIDRRP
jgi:hypothetical protein